MFIDTFPFNRDFRALKIRLAEIGEFADLIVISESPLTHSGKIKPLYLSENPESLGRFRDKIQIVGPQKRELATNNPRLREMIQRQAISKYLAQIELNSDDFIFHSDCDEIPRLLTLERIVGSGNKGNYIFELRNFANALNLEDGTWKRGRLVSFDYYRDIQQLRKDIFLNDVFEKRKLRFGVFRVPDFWTRRQRFINFPSFERAPEMEMVQDAGWHFNNLLEPSEVLEKIQNSSHTEWNTRDVRELALKRFLEGKDIYNGKPFKKVAIDKSYPETIYSNVSEWQPFIRI